MYKQVAARRQKCKKKNLEEHSNEIIRKLKVLDKNWYGGEIAKKKKREKKSHC